MASSYIEPEERQNVENADFNPLDEAVNEKTYSQPNVNVSDTDFSKPIEEPSFAPPPLEKKAIPKQEEKKREPLNPEMKSMPKKEVEMASSSMAKMLLQGYEWVHELANKGLKVSEKKLNKLQAEGEINLNAMIDYDYGKKMRAGDFFIEYNTQIDGMLSVSPEFKEEVTPVLERVLAKRGIGLTDEQLLMYMFGKDITAKAMLFFQQKAQLNYMIQSIKEATANQYVSQTPTPTPQPQEPIVEEAREQNNYEEFAPTTKPDVIIAPKKRGRQKKSV